MAGYIDNFSSYADGGLNGRGNWTAPTQFQVVSNDNPPGCNKGCYVVGGATWRESYMTFDNAPDGTMVLWCKPAQTNKDCGILQIRNGASGNIIAIGYSSDGTASVNTGDGNTSFGNYTAGVWYRNEVQWRGVDRKCRARVGTSDSSPGTFTSWQNNTTNQPYANRVAPEITGTFTIGNFTDGTSNELVDYYVTGADDNSDVGGASWLCQGITAPKNYTLSSVRLMLVRKGTGSTHQVTVELFASNSGSPTGPALSSGTLNGSVVTTTSRGTWFEINMSAFNMVAGTQYVLQAKSPSDNTTNCIYWADIGDAGGYTGGNMKQSTNSGSTWSNFPGVDMMFEAYGTVIPGVMVDSRDTGDNDQEQIGGVYIKAEIFTASENYTLDSIKIKAFKYSTPTGNIDLYLDGISGGKPDNTPISSGTYDVSLLGGTPGTWITIPMLSCNLVAGTQYAIVAKLPTGTYGSSDLAWRVKTGLGAAGGYIYSNNGGSTWTANTDEDLMFETYGTLTTDIFDSFTTGTLNDGLTMTLEEQTFTASETYSLTSVRLHIKKEVGITNDANVNIWNTSGDHKDGSTLGLSVVSYNNISTTAGWIEFVFSTPIKIINGTKYSITLNPGSYKEDGYIWSMVYNNAIFFGGYATDGVDHTMAEYKASAVWFKTYGTQPGISYDNTIAMNYIETASTQDRLYTVGTDANRILFVGADCDDGDYITGITYNGNAMTLLDKQLDGSTVYEYLYYLVNPTSGVNDIVTTASQSVSALRQWAVSYSGASQTGIPDATAKHYVASSATDSIAVTTVANNCWALACVRAGGNTLVAGANTTARATGDYSQYCNFFDNNGPKTPAGSVTLAFSTAGAGNWNVIAASFKPYLVITSNIKSFNGLAIASVKTIDGLVTASVKSVNGLA